MRRTKLQMMSAVLMAAMLMGGCGEEAYTLTEQEEELIANYSAHVVTKYNTYQKEGITYVWQEDTEDEDAIAQEPAAEQDMQPVAGAEGIDSSVPGDIDVEDVSADAPKAATLEEVFGVPGVVLDYVGARLADSYVEADYYALYPDAGKQYLVLGIDITNEGEEPVTIDYLTKAAKFRVSLNGEISSSSEMTVLMQDFSTFEATLKAGETRETILLFQIPETITSVDTLELFVDMDESYQIILENE